MAIETAFLNAGLPNLFSEEYNRFAAKWDVVKSTWSWPNHWYWIGSSQQWGEFSPDKFTVTEAGLEVVEEDRDQHALLVFPAVDKSWARVRARQPNAIWNPRNGGWFTFTQLPGTTPTPSRPVPPAPEDLWIQRMNEELAAIEKLALNPAEKERARDAVRKRYLGND